MGDESVVLVVLVLAEDEREPLKLDLLDTVRCDCSDRREDDRTRGSVFSYIGLAYC